MKIAVVGLIGSENLGEKFISKSLSYLIIERAKREGIIDIDIVEVDLEGRNRIIIPNQKYIKNRMKNYYDYRLIGLPMDIVYTILKKMVIKIPKIQFRNALSSLRHFIWIHSVNLKKRMIRFYEAEIIGSELVVIDGAGLLEYSKNEYQEYLHTLTEFCSCRGIPVVFNAIGRAGEFNTADYRCKILQSVFREESVKYVSARDSVENVQQCVGSKYLVKLKADAAFWVDKAYAIKHQKKDTRYIGIGLIRGNAVTAYGINYTENDWINLFVEIAKELEKRGFRYSFFTNGFPEDQLLGEKVICKLNVMPDLLIPCPTNDVTLLNTINSFDGLITCRMHSSIAAFSLGIPSVILSWNKKVNKYMNIVGYPERAIDLGDFNAFTIVNSLETVLEEGISIEKQEKMKKLAFESVDDYSYLFCK